MKTLNNIISVLVALSLATLSANAQINELPCGKVTNLSIKVNQMVTGSSQGYLSSAKISYGTSRCNFGVGAIMQNDYKKVTGFGAEYNYTAIKGEYNVDLYFNGTINYFHQTPKSIKYNNMTHTPEFAENVQAGISEYEKFNTLEAYAGFGILIKVVENLRIDAAVGIGGHYSNLLNADSRNSWCVFTQDFSAGLLLKVGLTYTIHFENTHL